MRSLSFIEQIKYLQNKINIISLLFNPSVVRKSSRKFAIFRPKLRKFRSAENTIILTRFHDNQTTDEVGEDGQRQ